MCEPAAIFSPLISSFSCTPWDCAVLSHGAGDAEAAGEERGNDTINADRKKQRHNNDGKETDFTVWKRSERFAGFALMP